MTNETKINSKNAFPPKLEAIFFAIFHPTQGPTVIDQVPSTAIKTSAATEQMNSLSRVLYPAQMRSEQNIVSDLGCNHNASQISNTTPAEGPLKLDGRNPLPKSEKAIDTKNLLVQPDTNTSAFTASASIADESTGSSSTEQCSGSCQTRESLFSFDDISQYIIPKEQFCNRITAVCVNGLQVLGHPVTLTGPTYVRNKFMFNCAVVVSEDSDATCFLPLVRQIARAFKAFESQTYAISSSENSAQIVHHIIEQVIEDLNNYSECVIPLSKLKTNSNNLVIFKREV